MRRYGKQIHAKFLDVGLDMSRRLYRIGMKINAGFFRDLNLFHWLAGWYPLRLFACIIEIRMVYP